MQLNRDDVKAATIEKLYQTFEMMGITRADADAAFMENAGMTIGEYVDAQLDAGISEVPLEEVYTGVYFVADGMIYGSENWEDIVVPTLYTLEDNTLTLTRNIEAPYILTRSEN